MPAALRLSLPTSSAPVEGAIDIDLASGLLAPTFHEAPVGRGMLLAQMSLFRTDDHPEIPSGQPFLMTETGDWRQLDLQRYGFGALAYGELSMALSPDGQSVALADPSGLATVDLRGNDVRRFDLPVEHAVALEWSTDAATLYFKDRDAGKSPCGPKGCALDVTTGDITAVDYDMFYASPGVAAEVVEVRGWTRSRPASVITHRSGEQPTSTALAYRASPITSGGPAVAARYVAFAQCPDGRKRQDEDGVVAVESSTGGVVAMLTSRRGGACHLGAQTWLTGQHLLVDDWHNGDLWLWDVEKEDVIKVATSRTTSVNIKVASEVMSQRFRDLLPN